MQMRTLTRAAVVAAFALSFNTASASAFQCEQEVNQALQERSVNQSDVDSVKVMRRTGGAKSSGIYGLDAWVRLKSCSNGALIVNMTKYCMVQNVYTTGNCSVADVPRY
ncbi:hypothetical protein [Pelagibius sp. 7325]|uniref:hypothetical protein n=1 Tax=Pelagibius sp. 7325 TaxID=3131994 RepID=UPI0030ECF182